MEITLVSVGFILSILKMVASAKQLLFPVFSTSSWSDAMLHGWPPTALLAECHVGQLTEKNCVELF